MPDTVVFRHMLPGPISPGEFSAWQERCKARDKAPPDIEYLQALIAEREISDKNAPSGIGGLVAIMTRRAQ